jgi:hypothetical protein
LRQKSRRFVQQINTEFTDLTIEKIQIAVSSLAWNIARQAETVSKA